MAVSVRWPGTSPTGHGGQSRALRDVRFRCGVRPISISDDEKDGRTDQYSQRRRTYSDRQQSSERLSPNGRASALLRLASRQSWIRARVDAFFHRHTLPDVRPILIAPRHQVTARAELQLLQRQSLHAYLDRLHFNPAFWTPAFPNRGINGCRCGTVTLPLHGTNLPGAILPDSP